MSLRDHLHKCLVDLKQELVTCHQDPSRNLLLAAKIQVGTCYLPPRSKWGLETCYQDLHECGQGGEGTAGGRPLQTNAGLKASGEGGWKTRDQGPSIVSVLLHGTAARLARSKAPFIYGGRGRCEMQCARVPAF